MKNEKLNESLDGFSNKISDLKEIISAIEPYEKRLNDHGFYIKVLRRET